MFLNYARLILFVSVVAFSTASGNRVEKKKVVCYLASWANYRVGGDGKGKYVVEDMDPMLCTHAIYAFAKLENNEIAVFDPYLDLKENWGLGGYGRFNHMREKNPELKTLIGIGGWNAGSVNYSQMASSPTSRATFVKSVVVFLGKYGFNGLDIDWEYPANRGGGEEDKGNFVLLLKELRAAFSPKGYLLTAAVSAGKATIDSAYDIPEMSKYVDLINVMTYDFHGAWENNTGINAPLYAPSDASVEQKEFTVDFAVRYWIQNGAPAEKLVMGVGFYGRSFTLIDPSHTDVGAETIGDGGKEGIYTKQVGTLGFNEICLHLTKDGWTEKWDDIAKAPYAFKDNQWVSYDNKQSIGAKMDYLKMKGLAGTLIWSTDTDDFRGTCYGTKNYLLTALTNSLWK